MPWDSLVRTKQLNKPELSGYIVDVLLQYLKTGAVTGIAMNTGQLTGQFYPRLQNPSGYVTTGQLTGYATRLEVTGNNIAVLSYVDTYYYSRDNPSGYIGSGYLSTGLMPKSGAHYSTLESFILTNQLSEPTLAFRPDNYWYLVDSYVGGDAPNGAVINFGGFRDIQTSYISGFDIWTTGFNGGTALSSGDINNLYVHKDYFDEAHRDYAHLLPSVFFFNNNPSYNSPSLIFGSGTFLLNGGRSGAPSESYFIDMLGMSAPVFGMTYTRPLIYGLDIESDSIKVTGFPVLTRDDLSGLATKNELYIASGQLDDDIWRLRTEVYEYLTGTGGAVHISGAGNIVVYQSGANYIISGGGGESTGVLSDTGQYVWASGGNQTIKGSKTFSEYTDFLDSVATYGAVIINDSSSNVAADLYHRWLYDAGENMVIDWGNKYLYNYNGTSTITLDWNNRRLSGNWDAGGLTISGRPVLTGNYLLSRATLQHLTGIFSVISGKIQISGRDVTTGGPYYPRGANPSGYTTRTGIIFASDDFDPVFFREFASTAIGPVVDISIEGESYYSSSIESLRYWFQVQGVTTGAYTGSVVYSELTTSGYYDNPGGYDMLLNWNPLTSTSQNYIMTLWTQPVGGGAPLGKFSTGGWAIVEDNKNGILYSTVTWESGTTGRGGPFGAIPHWVTWTGKYVRNLAVTGQEVTGNINLSGVGGLGIFVAGDTIFFSGGVSGLGGISGPYVSGIFVTGVTQTGLVSITGLGGVRVATSGTLITISGGASILGLPTDGEYGGSNGPIAGIAEGDRNEDAFDKVEVVLGKLAPSKPLTLAAATFGFSGTTYSANMQGTSTTFTNVMNNLQPTGYATGFYDADAGNLSGYINNTFTGIRTLSTGSDIGNYSGLKITNDFDYWAGIPGKAGFWSCINAQLSPLLVSKTGIIVMRMGHSQQGMTAAITGYCDTPQSPSSAWLASGTGIGMCTFRWTDGIISLANGDSVFVRYSGMNIIGPFYNSSQVGRLSSSYFSTANAQATGGPLSGSHMLLSGYVTANNAVYITGAPITLTTYNSASITNTYATTTRFYIDTVSSQQSQRHTAGTSRFISGGYNLNYDNTINLSGNEELQMINGLIQNPPKVHYGNFVPSGRNYSYVQTGSYSGCRWAMFDMGPITAVSNIILTFNSATNFSSVILPNFLLYVRVSGVGTNATAGWVNGNAAYPLAGNPSKDDDPALVVASSTTNAKSITFGTATLTGPVYIRVGLPSGSNMSFGSVSMTIP